MTGIALAQSPEVFLYRDNPDSNYAWADNYQSNRFVIRYSKDKSKNAYIASQDAATLLENLENAYDVLVHKMGFHPAHDAASATRYKCEVIIVSSTGSSWADGSRTAYGGTLGSAGARVPAIWISPGITSGNVITHELMHGLQEMSGGFQDSDFAGWLHESHANFMASKAHNTVSASSEIYTRQGHIHLGYWHTRYNNWLFLEYLADKFGMQFINDMWSKSYKGSDRANQRAADPFSELMRIHKISQSEFGDLIWEFGARNVIYDYQRKPLFRSTYNAKSVSERNRHQRFTYLEALDSTDGANGRFASPSAFAPQRYGYNIIRLYPNASTVKVRFRGDAQAGDTLNDIGSDWRYGLVAVAGDAASASANATARYTEAKRALDGNPDVEITLQSGETQLYLVVAATPTVNHKIKQNQDYHTIYRFPYMVEIIGAKPEGFQAVANPPGNVHTNGGGFVAGTARVAKTAYIGPNARVLGTAQVKGNARIEGRAIVKGGVVSGNAIVRDYAMVAGGTVTDSAIVSDGAVIWNGRISGNARVHGSSFVDGRNTKVQDNAQVGGAAWFTKGTLSGEAAVLGDGNNYSTASEIPAEVTKPRFHSNFSIF